MKRSRVRQEVGQSSTEFAQFLVLVVTLVIMLAIKATPIGEGFKGICGGLNGPDCPEEEEDSSSETSIDASLRPGGDLDEDVAYALEKVLECEEAFNETSEGIDEAFLLTEESMGEGLEILGEYARETGMVELEVALDDAREAFETGEYIALAEIVTYLGETYDQQIPDVVWDAVIARLTPLRAGTCRHLNAAVLDDEVYTTCNEALDALAQLPNGGEFVPLMEEALFLMEQQDESRQWVEDLVCLEP
ncbi:MAG: hypothetical protein JSW55_07990 [Chloroflexota bacterium]|nr:MAG: hypothetical protein JSW55_07990 [Chloroflexota bacterium]